jgi:4-amino-4-deoxy-L-arabinose transferase-like glycosyltransferase
MGLAISAKYSALALLPAGLVAVVWGSGLDRRQILKKLSIFIVTLSLVVIVLHPLLWHSPVRAVKEMVHARTDFMFSQVTTLQAHNPDQLLDTPGKKLGVMLYTVFLGAPQFEEAGNYSSILADDIDAYLSAFGNNLLSGPIWGGILLFFTLLGVFVGVRKVYYRDSGRQRRGIVLLIFMSVCQAGALLILNPLPYQRYYLPLIPFVCLWAALGLSTSSTYIKKAVHRSNG